MAHGDPETAGIAARRLARNLRLAYGALPEQRLSIMTRTPRMTLLEVAEAAVIGEMQRQAKGAPEGSILDARELAAAVLEAIGAKPVDPKRKPVP